MLVDVGRHSNGDNLYCGRSLFHKIFGDDMTDTEINNAGDISAIGCALKSLSQDVGTITDDQMTELFDLANELNDLLMDKMGLIKEEK